MADYVATPHLAPRYFDDVREDECLSDLTKGPMTSMHIMRWSAAIENWHRIHYDKAFAVDHDGLPGLLVNGSWKQHVLAELLTNWAGTQGWVWRIRFQYRGMDVCGDTVIASGKVTHKELRDQLGVVRCQVVLKNQHDRVSTEGEGIVVLPVRGGPPVPYPFVLRWDSD